MGACISSTMMVMMTAITPSLNASNRPLPKRLTSWCMTVSRRSPCKTRLRRSFLARKRQGLLLVALHFLELRVHHVVLAVALGGVGAGRSGGVRILLLGGIEALRQLAGDLGESLGLGLDGGLVVLLEGILQVADGGFHRRALLARDLVAEI